MIDEGVRYGNMEEDRILSLCPVQEGLVAIYHIDNGERTYFTRRVVAIALLDQTYSDGAIGRSMACVIAEYEGSCEIVDGDQFECVVDRDDVLEVQERLLQEWKAEKAKKAAKQ